MYMIYPNLDVLILKTFFNYSLTRNRLHFKFLNLKLTQTQTTNILVFYQPYIFKKTNTT